ncbi:nucleoside-diphosphate kinase [Candidatus Dojkabacteria bacterium]|nr:nucleoside-diphosphate kinase [Candidatus Dojkabacteria bacterium]
MSNSSKERTLVIAKHDAVARGLIGEIVSRLERVGLKLVGFEMIDPDRNVGQKHYPNSVVWKKKVGERTLQEYEERGIDAKKVLGTNDPVEIGSLVKEWNVDYLTSGPVVAMVWEGPNSVKVVRKLIGDTVPSNALPGTIRGDYSWDSPEIANQQKRPFYNLIHASGSKEEAEYEISLWFYELEVFDYDITASGVMGLKGKIQR